MKPDITIPPAALEAGCSAYTAVIYKGNGTQAEFREAIRAAFVAMVEAWPGAQRVKGYFTHDTDYYEPAFILPIAQKQEDRDGR